MLRCSFFALAMSALACVLPGCSLILNFEEPAGCTQRSDCDVSGGEYCLSGQCKAIDASICSDLSSAFTDETDREKVIVPIGSLMPLSGPNGAKGMGTIDGAKLAIDRINLNVQLSNASIPNAVFGVVTCDTSTDSGIDAAKSIKAATYMRETLGVSAIIGAISSDITIQVANQVTSKKDTLLVSPASTAPSVTTLDDNDLVWRTIASDSIQAPALATLVDKRVPIDDSRKVAAIVVDSAYGQGFQQELTTAWQKSDAALFTSERFKSFNYNDKMPVEEASRIGELLYGANNPFLPDVIILIGSSEGLDLLKEMEAKFSKTAQKQPLWVLSEAVRDQKLLSGDFADASERIIGTVFLQSNTAAYINFRTLYEGAFSGRRAVDFPFADKAWDAAFLIAMGIAAQPDPFAVTGGDIASVFRRTVGGEDAFDALPNQFGGAVSKLKAGEKIDFIGASGALDFDAAGDAPSSVASWSIDRGEGKFVNGETLLEP